MSIHLVTYGDQNMTRAAELCAESALRHGVASVWRWSEQELRASPFFRDNESLLSQPRGAGYWAWKPFLILDTLTRRCRADDVLIYADGGVEFVDNVRHIIDRMDQDLFLFGNNWQHAHWCKRDVIEEVWDLIALDQPYFDYSPRDGTAVAREANGDLSWSNFGNQCQASVIFLRATEFSRRFAREWLSWCLFEGGRLVDDSPSRTPNHPEFQEHRHDQAILTTLAYREGIKLHWWPASYNDGAFSYEKGDYPEDYPILFNHHRRRNSDWA